jgi:hypothetical protein
LVKFNEDDKPKVYELYQLEKKLRGIKSSLHAYFVRKYAFFYKVLHMPRDGHGILIGEPENNPIEICETLAQNLDCHFETPITQITEVYWRETLIKANIRALS